MISILKREIQNYFKNPIGYVFLSMFFAISGLLFFINIIRVGVADFTGFFSSLFLTIIFSMPVLTMGLFSDEYRFKTDRLLFSTPVSLFSIVFGKYVAAIVLYFFALSVNLIYIFVVSFFARLQLGLVVGCMFGTFFLGIALIAIGIFVSSITKNPVISAFGSFGIFIFLTFIGEISRYIPIKEVQNVLNAMIIMHRYNNFVMGILNISDILYFVSLVVVFISLTVTMLLKKRWS